MNAVRGRGDGRVVVRDPQRGASLVEFALVFPILALLLFGTIEFGIAFNDYQSVRHGAREAARRAVVWDAGDTSIPDDCTSAASGSIETRRLICFTKQQVDGIGGGEIRVKVKVPSYHEGEPLTLCVQKRLTSITGMFAPFLNGRVLTTRVEMRIERINAAPNGLESAEETSFGGSWRC